MFFAVAKTFAKFFYILNSTLMGNLYL